MIFPDHSWSFPILNNISFANKYIFSLRTNLVTFHQKCLLFNPCCKHMLNWWLSSSLGLSMLSYPSASPRLSSQSSISFPTNFSSLIFIFILTKWSFSSQLFISNSVVQLLVKYSVITAADSRWECEFWFEDIINCMVVRLFRGCRREKNTVCFLKVKIQKPCRTM